MATQKQMIDGSSIVEMEIIGDDHSDYDVDLSGGMSSSGVNTDGSRRRTPPADDSDPDEELDFMKATKTQVATGVATYVWEEGRQRAKKALNLYGNIDILRPYFDVEPHVVRNRLVHSLIPKLPLVGNQEKVPRELYGPTMVVLTLIAVLLFQMKSAGHTVQEGTLMGSAFGVCFTYWFGVSGLLWFLSYVCNTHITALQIFSMLGYGLFGHCVALFLSTIIHSGSGHSFFYMLWLVCGGLSTLRIVSILFARTSGKSQRMIMCGVVASIHMLFLLYLHFAYHQIVEELSYALDGHRAVPQPGIAAQAINMNNELGARAPAQGELGAHAPDQGEAAVRMVTEAIKRVVREANPVMQNNVLGPPQSLTNSSVNQQASIIMDALKPQIANMSHFNVNHVKQGLVQALNGTRTVVHRAVNASS